MVQNINMQYVFMENAVVRVPGQTDQLTPSSLHGAISMHRTNPGGRAITDHKLIMGFTKVQGQKKMYSGGTKSRAHIHYEARNLYGD